MALIGISAAQATGSIPLSYILILPILFAAGMTLVDSTDSVLMVKAYGWALTDQTKRLKYNLLITGISVFVALLVAGIEILSLIPLV